MVNRRLEKIETAIAELVKDTPAVVPIDLTLEERTLLEEIRRRQYEAGGPIPISREEAERLEVILNRKEEAIARC